MNNHPKKGKTLSNAEGISERPNESGIEPKREYMFNVVMNEACLNGDETCPCVVKEVKREYNPL